GTRGEGDPQLAADQVRVGDPHGLVAERLGKPRLLDDGGHRLVVDDADVELHRVASARASRRAATESAVSRQMSRMARRPSYVTTRRAATRRREGTTTTVWPW